MTGLERSRIIDECIAIAVEVGDDTNPCNDPDWFAACDAIVEKLKALREIG